MSKLVIYHKMNEERLLLLLYPAAGVPFRKRTIAVSSDDDISLSDSSSDESPQLRQHMPVRKRFGGLFKQRRGVSKPAPRKSQVVLDSSSEDEIIELDDSSSEDEIVTSQRPAIPSEYSKFIIEAGSMQVQIKDKSYDVLAVKWVDVFLPYARKVQKQAGQLLFWKDDMHCYYIVVRRRLNSDSVCERNNNRGDRLSNQGTHAYYYDVKPYEGKFERFWRVYEWDEEQGYADCTANLQPKYTLNILPNMFKFKSGTTDAEKEDILTRETRSLLENYKVDENFVVSKDPKTAKEGVLCVPNY